MLSKKDIQDLRRIQLEQGGICNRDLDTKGYEYHKIRFYTLSMVLRIPLEEYMKEWEQKTR